MGNRQKLYCTVAAAAVFAAFNGAATAADLPRKAPPAPPAPVVYAPNWAGFYIGGHIGYGWSKMTGDESGDLLTGDVKLKGGVAGVHAGYNWQFNQLVLGVEGDVSGVFGGWDNTVCTVGTGCGDGSGLHGSMQGLASIRGRLGWAFDNRWMIYATGGWGWGRFNGDIQSGTSIAPVKKTATGGVWGGGVEWKYNPNLSFRLEGLSYQFNKDVQTGSDAGDGIFHIHPVNVIRVGASYYFN
jgi:outer membrane immunogenic protein